MASGRRRVEPRLKPAESISEERNLVEIKNAG
jgi:hypothetical protein